MARDAINKLKAKYLEKNPDGSELIQIDCDGQTPNWADLQAVPLFATSRLVIIRGAGMLSGKDQEDLAVYLKDLSTTTVAVVWDQKPFKPNSPLSVRTDNAAKTMSAMPLTGVKLTNWILARAKELEMELKADQARLLVDKFEGDLWAIQSELITSRHTSVSTSKWARDVAEKPFAVFELVRAKNWRGLGKQIVSSHQSGEAIELTIGSLASAFRKYLPDSIRAKYVSNLSDIDLALKTGLIDAPDAAALLSQYLSGQSKKGVEWEELYHANS